MEEIKYDFKKRAVSRYHLNYLEKDNSINLDNQIIDVFNLRDDEWKIKQVRTHIDFFLEEIIRNYLIENSNNVDFILTDLIGKYNFDLSKYQNIYVDDCCDICFDKLNIEIFHNNSLHRNFIKSFIYLNNRKHIIVFNKIYINYQIFYEITDKIFIKIKYGIKADEFKTFNIINDITESKQIRRIQKLKEL